MAKLTLIGMYNFDDTLFEYLTLPDGIDKETLVNNILLQSGDFEVLYPNLDFLKMSIGAWSKKWQPTFERWQKVLAIEYDPLENYDRREHWTDTRDISGTLSSSTNESTSGSESSTSSGTTSGNTGSTTTNKVSAYDSGNVLTTKDQIEVTGSDGTSNSGQSSLQNSSTHTGIRNDSHSSDDDFEHTGRVHGNIGVTTSQQMLESELKLGYWNIYEKITDIFLTEFVLPIY